MKALPLVLCWLAFYVAASCEAAEKPNIIVIYTDDHGFADLGIRGVEKDVKTPHLDALARSGVIAKNGYSTAPQCVPSRGGLMIGKFQGRFDLDNNRSALDGFNKETTIATRLQRAGYATAQFGKWHLGPLNEIPKHGFSHTYSQHGQQRFFANITIEGKDKPMCDVPPEMYHIDGCAKAAAAVIERYKEKPFFLYIAFRAPHTPLDAPQSYKDRFPGKMPERRRAALGMLAAVDDGVGLVTSTLKKNGLTEKTLIFFIGDNGAPLGIHKNDSPLDTDEGGWDGSLNTPLNGEKGMLTEGGMHVPFLIAWPGTIPGGQTYEHPVSALDVAATAVAVADVSVKAGDLDGVNLVPYLKGEIATAPHEALTWRWMAQSAIREGDWKLLRGGEREYLYDLATDLEEKHNLAAQHPDITNRLRGRLAAWCAELNPPGLALGPLAQGWHDAFDFYLEGKPARKLDALVRGWVARGGSLADKDGVLVLTPDKDAKGTFITRTQLKLASPVTAKLTFKAVAAGQGSISWRMEGDKDFLPGNRVMFDVTAGDEWQTREVQLPAKGPVIHVRVHLPPGPAQFRTLDFNPASR